MTQELYKQIQELILMTTSLSLLIAILITMLKVVLYYYANEQTNKKEKEYKKKIKDLEERLETKTEIERLRYEHEQMLKGKEEK